MHYYCSQKSIDKVYVAIVVGNPEDSFSVDARIARHPDNKWVTGFWKHICGLACIDQIFAPVRNSVSRTMRSIYTRLQIYAMHERSRSTSDHKLSNFGKRRYPTRLFNMERICLGQCASCTEVRCK